MHSSLTSFPYPPTLAWPTLTPQDAQIQYPASFPTTSFTPYTMSSDLISPYQHQPPFNSQIISVRRDEMSPSAPLPSIPVSTDSAVISSVGATKTPKSRPRKVTSSVSRYLKAKPITIGTLKTNKRHIFRGIDVLKLPYPLRWIDVPQLGPPLPGPDPELLSDPSYSQEINPTVYECILGVIMTRKCRTAVEVIITMAEKLEWKILQTQKQGPTPSWGQRLLSTHSTVGNLLSRGRIPRDREGYYTITDPDQYPLPSRYFKSQPNGERTDAQVAASSEGSEIGTTPTLTLSPSSSLCPSMTGGSPRSSGVMGPPTPVFANSAAFTTNTMPVYCSSGNEVIQDWRNRQDVDATFRTIELDGLRYFLVPEDLIPTSVHLFERMTNAGACGYPQATNTSPGFLTQDYQEGLMAQSPVGFTAASSSSLIQPAYPKDEATTAGLMTAPYHVPRLYPRVPYLGGPSIDQPSGYAAGINWNESVSVPQSQDDLFGLYANL